MELNKVNGRYHTEKGIVDGNIKIALFMGWRLDNSFPDKGRVWRLGNRIELDTTFKFHSSWDVLMPCIFKHCEAFIEKGNPSNDRWKVKLNLWFQWADSDSKVRSVEDAWKYLVECLEN